MAEAEEQKVNPHQHTLTDRETTEAWLTEKQIPFHVSFSQIVVTILII